MLSEDPSVNNDLIVSPVPVPAAAAPSNTAVRSSSITDDGEVKDEKKSPSAPLSPPVSLPPVSALSIPLPSSYPVPPSDTVIIAFINFNSGGKMGGELLSSLQKSLGEDRVFNLNDGGPKKGFKIWFGHPRLRIVIGGGDGTINWVLSFIRALYSTSDASGLTVPPACFIPLGTGNDTSRVFGWGFKFPGSSRIASNINYAKTAQFSYFDRFHIAIERTETPPPEIIKHLPHAFQTVTNAKEQFPIFRFNNAADLPKVHFISGIVNNGGNTGSEMRIERKSLTAAAGTEAADSIHAMSTIIDSNTEGSLENVTHQAEFNNYLSFGMDAQTMFGFHHCRENYRSCFPCRCCNMACVGLCGAKTTCLCQTTKMGIKIEARDGVNGWKEMLIPSGLSGIVIVNVWSYGGGRRPWGKSSSSGESQSMDDGRLEIMGIKNSLHLGLMMLHCTSALRIGQASEIRITMNNRMHVQLDGEPWQEWPCTYHIRALPRARVLVGPEKDGQGLVTHSLA